MRDTKGDLHDRPSAPDFTSACVFMFGVNLIWILIAIWAVWGFLALLGTAYAVKKWVEWVAVKRN